MEIGHNASLFILIGIGIFFLFGMILERVCGSNQNPQVRYYGKRGWDKLVRVDYHGSKEVPKGTCHAILKAAGIKRK